MFYAGAVNVKDNIKEAEASPSSFIIVTLIKKKKKKKKSHSPLQIFCPPRSTDEAGRQSDLNTAGFSFLFRAERKEELPG